MGREDTTSRRMIREFCAIYQLDAKVLLNRSELLLESYRKICFARCLDDEEYEDEEMEEKKPIDVVLFLENLDPTMSQVEFVNEIQDLADKNWIVEMVESAMVKLHKTPVSGELYFELINKRYIIQLPYTEPEMLERLNLGRARYYDRRWEALVMFGLCFWGSVLPKMKKMLEIS